MVTAGWSVSRTVNYESPLILLLPELCFFFPKMAALNEKFSPSMMKKASFIVGYQC